MKKIKIESSTLNTISYDVKKELLTVEFKRGAVYNYYSVDYETVLGLVFADSCGSYFNKNIAKNFNYEKVSG